MEERYAEKLFRSFFGQRFYGRTDGAFEKEEGFDFGYLDVQAHGSRERLPYSVICTRYPR